MIETVKEEYWVGRKVGSLVIDEIKIIYTSSVAIYRFDPIIYSLISSDQKKQHGDLANYETEISMILWLYPYTGHDIEDKEVGISWCVHT